MGGMFDTTRSCPGVDGCKVVERRVLLGVRDIAKGQFQRSNLVCGHILGHYHPHGDCFGSLVKMVRCGFVEGHGNFGDAFSPPAAMRYTSVKAKTHFSEGVFRFADFVPMRETEFGTMEPCYLPVPLPLCLFSLPSVGIGVGMLSSMPVFTLQSLYVAMKKDNPSLLKAPRGLTIVSSSLQDIWETGRGYVQYGLRCYQEKSEGDENRLVSIIEGSPQVFVPDLERIFSSEIEEELIYIRNESVENIRFVVSRVKGIKRISDEELHAKANQASTKTLFCKLYVSDGEVARITPLREWLTQCWNLYCKAFENYKRDQIETLEHKIYIFELIPRVYPLLLQEKKTQEIMRELNETTKVIQEIEGKPLRLLRKKDFDEEIRKLRGDVRAVQDLTAENMGEEFINSF